MSAIDGNYSVVRQIGPARKTYPFAQYGDFTNFLVERMFTVKADNYVAPVLGTPDPEYPEALLVEESSLSEADLKRGEAVFRRVYSVLPEDVVTGWSDLVIDTPSYAGGQETLSGLLLNPLGGGDADGYLAHAVTVDTGPVPSAGTYTLTLDGNTTGAIAYDASESAIESAITASSLPNNVQSVNVRQESGNDLEFGGVMYRYEINVDGSLSTASVDISSLTFPGTGVGTAVLEDSNTVVVDIYSDKRLLTVPGHGIVNNGRWAMKYGTAYEYDMLGSLFTIFGAVVLDVVKNTDPAYHPDTFTIAGEFTRNFTQTDDVAVRTRRLSKFYWPGVTPGIDDASDISRESKATDTDYFHEEVLKETAWVNWDFDELRFWRGPILQQTMLQVANSEV